MEVVLRAFFAGPIEFQVVKSPWALIVQKIESADSSRMSVSSMKRSGNGRERRFVEDPSLLAQARIAVSGGLVCAKTASIPRSRKVAWNARLRTDSSRMSVSSMKRSGNGRERRFVEDPSLQRIVVAR
jgi:hypothetical protein